MNSTDVSIIIVNYHSAELVIDCINSIFEKTTGISYEIIVVDNASGDGSVEKLRDVYGNRIQVIASDENLGFGKANNLGCQYAKGNAVFLLNPDTILVNNAIKILYDELQAHTNYGVVGGNLYMPDMGPAPSYCLHFDDLETEKKSAAWLKLISGKIQQKLGLNCVASDKKEHNDGETMKQVAYIFGADMMLRKDLYNEMGGFDPDFFMYYEEEELTWRITQKGYKVCNIPDAKIIHLDGATVKSQDEFSERQFRMRMNGALTYYKKRYGDVGVQRFVELRCKRYARLMKIAKIQNKLTDDFLPAVQKKLLEEEYLKFYMN